MNDRSSLPPCCGTGCAVCVLDYTEEYTQACAEFAACTNPEAATEEMDEPPLESPQCCNSGCLVCVRDYPELLGQSDADTTTLDLLKAIEQAQTQTLPPSSAPSSSNI